MAVKKAERPLPPICAETFRYGIPDIPRIQKLIFEEFAASIGKTVEQAASEGYSCLVKESTKETWNALSTFYRFILSKKGRGILPSRKDSIYPQSVICERYVAWDTSRKENWNYVYAARDSRIRTDFGGKYTHEGTPDWCVNMYTYSRRRFLMWVGIHGDLCGDPQSLAGISGNPYPIREPTEKHRRLYAEAMIANGRVPVENGRWI